MGVGGGGDFFPALWSEHCASADRPARSMGTPAKHDMCSGTQKTPFTWGAEKGEERARPSQVANREEVPEWSIREKDQQKPRIKG